MTVSWGMGTVWRPLIMWAVRPFPQVAFAAIMVRAVFLLAFGWPVTASVAAVTVITRTGPPRAALLLVAVVWAIEAAAGYLYPGWRLWRQAAAVRRRWPTKWAIIDNATADVQASFGGGVSSFLNSSKRLPRPVLAHPPLGLIPRVGAGRVVFRCGPPFGTTLDALAKTTPAIAALYSFPNVDRVDVDYGNDSASWGWLTFWFAVPPDDLEHVDPDELPADFETIEHGEAG